MKLAGIIILLFICMILATGCVNKVERGLNVKNEANFPTNGSAAPTGVPLSERVQTLFGLPQGSGSGSSASTDSVSSAPADDRQKAYENLLKQMNGDSPDDSSSINDSAIPNTTPSETQVPIMASPNSSLENLTGYYISSSGGKPSNNLLNDESSFDNGINNWTRHNGTLSSDTSNIHDGTGDAKFVTTSPRDNYIEYNVSSAIVASSTEYTLSAWIKGINNGTSYIQVINRARNGGILGINNGSAVVSNNDYQRSIVTFTTPIQTDRVSIRVHSLNPGTIYVDSVKLEMGFQATDYTDPVDFSRLQHYPDIMPLGQKVTYGLSGYERDVSIYQYRLKSNFVIGFAGRYGPALDVISAPTNMTFLFLYIQVAHNGTVGEIPRPMPGDFSILVNNSSYSYYTVDQSVLQNYQEFPDVTEPIDNYWNTSSDNSGFDTWVTQATTIPTTVPTTIPTTTPTTTGTGTTGSWNNITYTIHDDLGFVLYDEGYIYPKGVYTGMLIFLVPDTAGRSDVFAKLDTSYLSRWFKSPVWQLRSAHDI